MHKEGLSAKELRTGCGSHVLMGGKPCHFGYSSLREVEVNTHYLYDNAILRRNSFGNTPVIDSYSNAISADPEEMLDAALRFNAGAEVITRLRCLAAFNAISGDLEKVAYATQLYSLTDEEKAQVANLHRRHSIRLGIQTDSIEQIVKQLTE
jgi:hypothetical protein